MSIIPENLFAAAGAAKQGQKSKFLVELKAGKMFRDTNNLVRPDNRRGLVYLKKSPEDSLLHFCWKDRKSNQEEDDLIIFPDDAKWQRITQCTTGRVYVLKFKSSSQRLFFWLQEPNVDNDENLAKKINDLMNGNIHVMDDQEISDTAMSAEQNQLLQMLASQGIIPSNLGSTNETTPDAQPTGVVEQQTSSLTPELLRPVLSDENLRQRLFPLVPEHHGQSEEELQSLVRSPQFSQAVHSLDAAIRSGELGPLIAELGLDPSIATTEGDRVLALLVALKRQRQNPNSQ